MRLPHLTLFAVLLLAGFGLGLGLRAGLRAEPGNAPAETGTAPGTAPERTEPSAPAERGLLVDLDNRVCPVMGGEVDGEHFIEWNHLRVGFCCAGCDRPFLEDPEAALAKTEADWRAALDAIERWRKAEGAERAEALRDLREGWTVLRGPEGGTR